MRRFLKKINTKKTWHIVAINTFIVGIASWSLVDHYRNFSFSKDSDPIYRVESFLLDLKIRLRGPLKTSGKVGILAIDEASIEEFGRWPFSRRYYGQAFENLKKIGVEWIGFDTIFSEPESAYLEDFKSQIIKGTNESNVNVSLAEIDRMMKVSPSDESFALSIKNFANVVLGYFFFSSEHEVKENLSDRPRFEGFETLVDSGVEAEYPQGKTIVDYPRLKKAYGLVNNTSLYLQSSKMSGFFSNDSDSDAINRWGILLANINGELMPSLSLKTVSEYLGKIPYITFDDFGIESVFLLDEEDPETVIELPIDPRGAGRLLINPLGPAKSFKHYSLKDAYYNQFTEDEKKALNGSVLLLGATATGINDIRPNPFDGTLDGVENHAAIMENIITQNFLKRPKDIYGIEILIALAIGVIFTPIMIWSNSVVSGLSVVIFLMGYYYFDQSFWFEKGIWAYMAIPCFEIVTIYLLNTLYKYRTEENEKKVVKGAFQHYLSPDVIEQVLEDPTSLKLGGEKKNLTVLFSDVRSFTTISESLEPEKLSELMNDYFTPMTDIVLNSGGVLDKYIGDAIMAFWGAPLELKNAADLAATSSIEMLFALDRLKDDFIKKGFPPIDIGIGLNTGAMSVGNMGSGDRFTYTVMGDAVNLGARLEGLTKEYGVKILISENTVKSLTPEKFFIRDLDDIRVKGKTDPVKVFELMRPDFLYQESHLNEFIDIFESARSEYTSRSFEKAKILFNQCLQLKQDDLSTIMYLKRVGDYVGNPPEENWDGVYNYTHK